MSVQACADLVARGDPDRFAAAMAAPVSARAVLFPLYAFNLEVARAPWVTAEAMIAEMRLQWWRDVLEEIAKGGAVRRHEVATPLAEILDAKAAEDLDSAVAARRWDIYRDPFEDAGAFSDYLSATSGTLVSTAARLFGAKDVDAAGDIGWAAGLANWFLAIPKLEDQGRIPLVDGRPEAVAALAELGLQRLKARISKPEMPAVLAAANARAVLTKAAKRPELVAVGGLQRSDFAKRISVMRCALTGRV